MRYVVLVTGPPWVCLLTPRGESVLLFLDLRLEILPMRVYPGEVVGLAWVLRVMRANCRPFAACIIASLIQSSRRGALLHQINLMLSDLLQLPPKVLVSNLRQQLSQVGVGVRAELIVVCLLALVLLGGSRRSSILFDVLVKIDADHLVPLRGLILLVLNGAYPEWGLLLDLLSWH